MKRTPRRTDEGTLSGFEVTCPMVGRLLSGEFGSPEGGDLVGVGDPHALAVRLHQEVRAGVLGVRDDPGGTLFEGADIAGEPLGFPNAVRLVGVHEPEGEVLGRNGAEVHLVVVTDGPHSDAGETVGTVCVVPVVREGVPGSHANLRAVGPAVGTVGVGLDAGSSDLRLDAGEVRVGLFFHLLETDRDSGAGVDRHGPVREAGHGLLIARGTRGVDFALGVGRGGQRQDGEADQDDPDGDQFALGHDALHLQVWVGF